MPPDFGTENLLSDIKSAAGPVASQFVSEASEIATKVKSAATSAATGFLRAIERTIPQNLSLGTQSFCVGFIDDVSCQGLPLNLSDLLPSAVEDLPDVFQTVIQDAIINLQPIATALTNIAYIRIFLVLGLVLC